VVSFEQDRLSVLFDEVGYKTLSLPRSASATAAAGGRPLS